jgi:methionyl-tRNA synthetase
VKGKDWGTVLERSRNKLVHFIGKDTSFSLCDFPAMLKAEEAYFADNVLQMSFELRRK